jgi:hypothetical protein
MSITLDVENMFFSEVPNDAFTVFDDIPQEQTTLINTDRAWCPYCLEFIYNLTVENTGVPCMNCITSAEVIQKVYRGYYIRQRISNLYRKELMNRWFMTNNVSGGALSECITAFL